LRNSRCWSGIQCAGKFSKSALEILQIRFSRNLNSQNPIFTKVSMFYGYQDDFWENSRCWSGRWDTMQGNSEFPPSKISKSDFEDIYYVLWLKSWLLRNFKVLEWDTMRGMCIRTLAFNFQGKIMKTMCIYTYICICEYVYT